MGPVIGMLLGGGASGLFGGAGGGGLMGGLMGNLLQNSGGFSGLISNLFGGGQQPAGNQQTNELLGDIKEMLGKLLDQKGGPGGAGDCGPSHGAMPGGCDGPYGGGHDCAPKPMPEDCGHGCDLPKEPECGGGEEPGCDGPKEPDCGSEHDCGGVEESEWDGKDKSPSLDRERGAARLLEQARNTDDPDQKRELIDMALDMLGKGPKDKGLFGKVIKQMDGNSYDNDVVKQGRKMLEQIDDGHLSGCNESKALDSVIDMLMGEGGVDGKPAANDLNGDGRYDKRDKLMDAGILHAA